MQIGLRKYAAVSMLQVLQTAFTASATTGIGSWTDDGAQIESVSLRGVWSAQAVQYPEISVRADLGTRQSSAGGLLKMSTIAKGQLQVPVYGDVMNDVRIHLLVKTESEDTLEQLCDLIDMYLATGVNSYGVRYSMMLANRGVSLMSGQPDVLSQRRQDRDPAHAIVFANDLVYRARVQFSGQQAAVPLTSITFLPVTITLGPSHQFEIAGSSVPT